MNLRILLFLCVLSLPVSLSGAAQDGLSLKDKVKSSIKEKEPAWELSQDTEVAPDESSDVIILKWSRGKASVEAVILTYESKEKSLENYRHVERGHVFGGMSMNASEDKSLTVGDKRFVWADAYPTDAKGVIFVRGRMFVHINAQDLEVAEKFAKLIDAQLSQK